MNVNEQKKQLRKALLQKRKLLCDSETAVKNAAITENLLSLEKVRTADTILRISKNSKTSRSTR